jgi:N-acetylmuramoyl-L-alanine amidase
MLICIDAGHAENTAGKRSPDGSLREYEFNRDVAKRLSALLEKQGIKTMFSCDLKESTDLPLTLRCAAANNANADLFISIHANAHGDGKDWTSANGWEIYHYKGSVKGKKLAETIHAESCATLGLRDRGIKTNSFHVLKNTHMPAVLIEHGFYTNKEECEKLKTPAFRESCAGACAKGILNYLSVSIKRLPYQIRITVDALNVRRGPGVNYPRNTVIRDKKLYTIVEEQSDWGRLKSGAGWISLNYTKRA